MSTIVAYLNMREVAGPESRKRLFDTASFRLKGLLLISLHEYIPGKRVWQGHRRQRMGTVYTRT